MHTVGRHGGFGNITVLVEDTPLISLTDQLGCAGATLGGVEGLQGLVEFGVVELTWEAAGGFWVGVGGPGQGWMPTTCDLHSQHGHESDKFAAKLVGLQLIRS